MITTKVIHEIQIDKPTLTQQFIRKFDEEWSEITALLARCDSHTKQEKGCSKKSTGGD